MTSKIISSFKMTKALLPVLLLTLVLVFAVGIGDVSAAPGDNIYVNDTGGNDDNDGSTWETAKKTIKNATNNVNPNGIINIANGQYNGSSNTGITIDKNMTINGESQTGTIINGTGINWIFHVNQGINFTLNNLTITNATGSDGSVIYNNDGSVYVSDCSFIDNTATFAGGGVIYNNVGSVYVSDCSFIGNTATSYGGAIYNYGNVYVSDSSFTSNTAIIGGVIYNNGGESVVTGCSFTDNTATFGGVIYNNLGSVSVSDSSFIGNTANYGGVIVNPYDSSVSVTNSSFSGNTANYYGGAIYNDGGGGGGALSVTGTSFTGNIAFYSGGVIYNDGSESVVTGCSFTGNTAFSTGGGIYNTHTLTVTDSIFTDNTATTGGAIYNLVRLTANFNRILGNYPTAIHNLGLFVDAQYNWWGSNNPDFTTLISGVVDYSPWLYMTLQANPTNIVQGDASTLTASFNNAFDGTTVTPLNPDNGHIPDKTPVTFSTDLGSIGSKTINKETTDGIATATLTADETPGTAHVNAVTDAQTVNNEVIINPKSSLYLTITPSKTNPLVGDTVIYTLKVGNKGPNTAENVVMTYTIPKGLEFAGANVDNGTYTYDPKTRTITWNIGDVPVADPYMWLSLKVLSSGTYVINPTLSTSTYDPTINANTQSLIINAAATPNNNNTNNTNNNNINNTNNTVNAATNTVTMQDTGIPLILLIMALFLVIGGLVSSKK
ncbi:MAG: hypothetical protein Q8M06_03395 [Methanobacteriaceae archaeon]|nr:hypothetical protein [Methanobacteriaceae archaeon]